MDSLIVLILVLLAFFVLIPQSEGFALHDKPASWTHELIRSQDPTKEELWNLSQAYLTNDCDTRIAERYLPSVGNNGIGCGANICK